MKGLAPRIAAVKKFLFFVNPFVSYRGNTENGQKWSLTPWVFFDFRIFIFFQNFEIMMANERGEFSDSKNITHLLHCALILEI